MTPLQFQARHAAAWAALEQALAGASPLGSAGWVGAAKVVWMKARRSGASAPQAVSAPTPAIDAAQLCRLYRQACEHLAMAQARRYPADITLRLDHLTQRAHQHIYRHQTFSLMPLLRMLGVSFPQATRALGGALLWACLLFVLPALALGLWCAFDPGAALHLFDANTLQRFEQMYAVDGEQRLGRMRGADTDWAMFGFYIVNNIGIAFQCFATGITFGLGSLFYLVANGLWGGGVAGYLTARGAGVPFWSFVVTHAAFEITAIVLSGAAGLRLGQALLMPGRRSRVQALRNTAQDLLPVLYGLVLMLVLAALIEAFWSSARWVLPEVKYGVGALCWALVLGCLWRGGR